MAKKYDVVATIGKYEKDGQTKYISRNVGAVIETQHGLSIKMDASFNPAGCQITEDGKIWLKLFEPRDNSQGQKQSGYSQSGGGGEAHSGGFGSGVSYDDLDDSIPFISRWGMY